MSRWIPLILFFLPWQTRYIFEYKTLNGGPWEYGVLSVYAVELLVLGAFFLLRRPVLRREHQLPVRLMGVVLLAVLLSVPFSLDPELSFMAWLHVVIAGLLFVILLDQRVSPRHALLAFAAGLIIPAMLGFSQVFTGVSPSSSLLGLASHEAADLGTSVVEGDDGRLLRAYGSFGHPNVFGGYLAMGILAATLAFGMEKKGKRDGGTSLAIIAISVVMGFALVLTFSRSAWIAFVLALLVWAFFMLWKAQSRLKSFLPIICLTLIAVVVAGVVFRDPILVRTNPTFDLEERSISEREAQYRTFPAVVEGRVLLGVGAGVYTGALAIVEPGLPSWSYQPIHNAPLLILGETGVVGLLAVIAWAVSVDRVNYRRIRQRSVGAIGGIALGTILLVVALLDHYMWSSWSGLALMAFAMAMTLRLSERD